MTDLSIWAKLDGWRALQEIIAISGNSSLFDQWSLLDPARAAAQMSVALGVEITQYDLLDPSSALIARVQEALDDEGDGYEQNWVYFDGTVSFGTASLSAPADSGLVLISFWGRKDDNPESAQNIFLVDGRQPGGAYASSCFWANDGGVPFLPKMDVYLSDSASNNWIGSNSYSTPAGRHHFLIYGDLDHADPDKIFRVYKDDVDVTYSPQHAGPAFKMSWNGKSFDVGSAGDETTFMIGELADLHIIVPSAPLDEAGELPESVRRLFIDADGNPVDPATATAAALGTDIVLCTGDASTFTGSFTPSPGSSGSLVDVTWPEWVPATAKIHIDLVNDRAWTEADGIVAIDTLLGSDPNTENAWGSTEYNADDLTADGLVYSEHPPALIGAARSSVLTGSTTRVTVKQVGDPVNLTIILTSEDGNDAIEIDSQYSDRKVTGYSYGGSASVAIETIVNVAASALNVVAATITPERLEVASNGSNTTSDELVDADWPVANPIVAVVIESAAGALQSITIYDPLPDTTGLSALSETGVTNTAPHSLIVTWDGGVPDGVISEASASGGASIATFTVTDDEGNPTTASITAGSAEFEIYDPEFMGVRIIDSLEGTLSVGIHAFTLRATDPGDLYVEQEFTITVTEEVST